ncbi:MAG: hypothetical protein ACO1O1_16415 [Adhaeribacter sp.]
MGKKLIREVVGASPTTVAWRFFYLFQLGCSGFAIPNLVSADLQSAFPGLLIGSS